MTATKGPSNLYGNKNHVPTKHISYPYAKEFNNSTLYTHFNKHKKDFRVNSINEYEDLALKFANEISTVAISFVDKNNSTYKYDLISNSLVIVNKEGVVITFFKPKKGIQYYNKQKEEKINE